MVFNNCQARASQVDMRYGLLILLWNHVSCPRLKKAEQERLAAAGEAEKREKKEKKEKDKDKKK
jgi:hypothetical protein